MNQIGKNIVHEINRTKKDSFTKEEIIKLVKDVTSVEEYEVIELNGVTLNSNRREVTVGGKVTKLQKSLFNLLYFLAQHKNEPQRREVIMRDVWGNDVFFVNRTIDVHVHTLRGIIGKDKIITQKKLGYVLVD
jgi:two-component system alkaline phosphatase synthesis response regulator PhoP